MLKHMGEEENVVASLIQEVVNSLMKYEKPSKEDLVQEVEKSLGIDRSNLTKSPVLCLRLRRLSMITC